MDSDQKTTTELYGIIMKEYIKTSLEHLNIAKSNDVLSILKSGSKIITNVFKSQCTHANDFEKIYKTCKQAIIIYFEYIDQVISTNKFTIGDTINANIFIFSKLIKSGHERRDVDILRASNLCDFLFDWTNEKYTTEDRNAIAETFLSGYIELFSTLEKAETIISSIEMMREKYGSLNITKFRVFLKELYYVLRKYEVTKDRFEIYAIVSSDFAESQYTKLLLTEDKKEYRTFFMNVFF